MNTLERSAAVLLASLAAMTPAPSVASGQAARTLGLAPSTVTRLVDRMVAARHVTRGRGINPRHRGMVTLELTASGQDLVAAADA